MGRVHSLRKIFVPPDWLGLGLLIANLALPFVIYESRLRAETLSRTGGMGTAFALALASPVICAVGVVTVAFIAVTLRYAFKRNGHPMPAFLMLVALIFGALYPLPPTPEETSFSNYQADYVQVVELARKQQLQHAGTCLANIAFALPSKYRHLNVECVFVENTPAFFVEFPSMASSRIIVYTEVSSSPQASVQSCGGDGASSIFKQLDEHWYICNEDVN